MFFFLQKKDKAFKSGKFLLLKSLFNNFDKSSNKLIILELNGSRAEVNFAFFPT